MKSGINLIAPRSEIKKDVKRINLITLITFLTFFGIASIVLLYVFILNSTLTGLGNKRDAITEKLSSISEKRDRQIFIKDRLSNIEKVIKERKKLDEKISAILGIFPQSLQINSISAKNLLISIELQSSSLSELDNLINKEIFSFAKAKKNIKKISMNNFSIVSPGNYSLALEFNLSEDIFTKAK